MTASLKWIIVATAITVVYAMALTSIYPHLTLDAQILSLCALAALLTTLGIAGLWRLLRGAKPT